MQKERPILSRDASQDHRLCMSAEGAAHFSTHPYIVRRAFILQTPESKSHSGMALAGQSWQPRRPEFETTNADILTYAIGIMAFAYTSTCIGLYPHIHKRTQTKMIGQSFVGGSCYGEISRARCQSQRLASNPGPPAAAARPPVLHAILLVTPSPRTFLEKASPASNA